MEIPDSEEKALYLLGRVLLLTKSPDDQDQAGLETLSALQKIGVDLQHFLSDTLSSVATKGAGSYLDIATAMRSSAHSKRNKKYG